MKKIFIYFLFFLIVTDVYAKDIYYSDYEDVFKTSETIVENNDTTLVEEEKLYRWYQVNKQLGDYYLEGDNPPEYPQISKTDYYETEFIETFELPETINNRIIEEKTLYIYQDVKEIDTIKITNLGQYSSFWYEIEVFHQDNKIAYAYRENNVLHIEKINDSDYNSGMVEVKGGGSIIFTLQKSYPPDEIKINIVKMPSSDCIYEATYSSSDSTKKYYLINESITIPQKKIELDSEKYIVGSLEWQEEKTTNEEIAPSPFRAVTPKNYYRYKDIYYRYYDEQIIYKEGFYKTGDTDFPYRDEANFKTTYQYKNRDKIMVDDLIITNKNKSVKDLITSTTPYQIIGDINYNVNGVYNITIKLPYLNIDKKVMVLIKENEQSKIDNKVKPLNNEITSLNEEIKSLKAKILSQTNQNEQLLFENKNLKNQVINYQEKLTNLNLSYDEKVKKLTNNSQLLEEKIGFKDKEILSLINKQISSSKDEAILPKENKITKNSESESNKKIEPLNKENQIKKTESSKKEVKKSTFIYALLIVLISAFLKRHLKIRSN